MPDLIGRELLDCTGDKIGFSVPGRITICVYGIHGGENHLAVQDQKSAEWMVAVAAGLAGEGNCLSGELLVGVQRCHAPIIGDRRGIQRHNGLHLSCGGVRRQPRNPLVKDTARLPPRLRPVSSKCGLGSRTRLRAPPTILILSEEHSSVELLQRATRDPRAATGHDAQDGGGNQERGN